MKAVSALTALLLLQACRHPLVIVGQGDIVERIAGVRGCTYEEFQAQTPRCTENDVTDAAYQVSYEAIPREGWVFKGWEGVACGAESQTPYCEYDFIESWVDITNETWPGIVFPATVAVFEHPETYFDQHIASQVLDAKCLNCHYEGGLSGHTRLVLDKVESDQQNANNVAVFDNFLDEVDDAAALIRTKIRGGAGHGGGSIFSSGSEDFAALSTFLELLEGEPGSGGSDLSTFWDGITLENHRSTLRRAAIILGGRLPTEAEYQLAESSKRGLRQALHALLQGEGFHEFLISGANDRLHTDAFLNGLNAEILDLSAMNAYYPVGLKKFFTDRPTNDEEQEEKWRWESHWLFGIARAPLELIAWVVENDRPYTKILTAEHTMVNYISSEIQRSDVDFGAADPLIFKPGRNRGQIFDDDQRNFDSNEFGTDVSSHGPFLENYPHAGVLNTQAFLARYPSTESNRNRARARWTYLHFLGVDIEKSASRTTDPTALADTNNPTLNNPACAVCHQLHDPVAGTFQNYGNDGFYRGSFGGLDSLPDTYKYPEDFDEDAAPSPYQEGDTWYRDMRKPGFEGQTTGNRDSTLRWLARQITEDDRFAVSSVKFWWPAVMGVAVLEAPEASGDSDFDQRLAAFEVQTAEIEALAKTFREGISGGWPYNLRDLLVEMVMSPWFRADFASASALAGRDIELDGIGNRRLLTPRELDNKTRAIFGAAWGEEYVDWTIDGRYTALMDTYRIYYGGIDSVGIKDRIRQLTSLMRGVAQVQALNMACGAVVLDFNRAEEDKLLFQGIDRETSPLTDAGESALREKLVELHERFLGEKRSPSDAEIDASYRLLVETWEARMETSDDWFVDWSQEDCNITEAQWEWLESQGENYGRDSSRMLGSWASLLIYLMTDFRYLHE